MFGSYNYSGLFVCVIVMCKIILISFKWIMSLKIVWINFSVNRINLYMFRV